MRLVGRLDADATNSIANLVTPISQCFVFLLSDRLGVSEGMGCQRSVGIGAKNIHVHLGSLQSEGLLAETKHLLGAEFAGQIDAVAIPIRPRLAATIQG